MHFIIFTSLLFGIFASSPILTLLVMQCPVTGFSGGARGKEPDCPCERHGDHGLSPRWGGPSGGGHGSPLQYSRLENSMDGRAWQATVHGVSKVSDTTEET